MDMTWKEMKMSNPWEKIKTPLSSYNVRRTDYTHSFDFFWGKDISDDYLFLFECDASIRFPSKVPMLQGVDVSLPVSDVDRKTRLILRLNNKDDWDIFYALCLDLIECNLFSLSVLCYLFVEILVGIPQYGQYVTV